MRAQNHCILPSRKTGKKKRFKKIQHFFYFFCEHMVIFYPLHTFLFFLPQRKQKCVLPPQVGSKREQSFLSTDQVPCLSVVHRLGKGSAQLLPPCNRMVTGIKPHILQKHIFCEMWWLLRKLIIIIIITTNKAACEPLQE